MEPLIINQTNNSKYVQLVSANFLRELQYFKFLIIILLDHCLQLQHLNTQDLIRDRVGNNLRSIF